MKILIADDHNIVRKGIKLILAEAYPLAEIEDVTDSAELVNKATKKHWTVIISDITMPGRPGIDVIKELKDHSPETPILILSAHSAEEYAVRSIKAGASGYLTKESAPDELIKAVEYILTGKRYLTSEVTELLIDANGLDIEKAPHETLSNREFEVMKLLASGQSIADMAETLSLSSNTVSTYRARIMEKMHIHTNTELIKYAIYHKLV
jgi:two-component system, NarL family, invasion response regulator UvrY